MHSVLRPFKLFTLVLAIFLLFVGLFVTILVGRQSQDYRSRAFVGIPSDPTPTAMPGTCNSLCFSDEDCSSGYCYQPPMPECPVGAECIQVMPPRICRDATNPDSVKCIVPFPTTTVCTYHPPHVTLSPAVNTGSRGQTLTYNVSVQNTNTGPCPPETFPVESFPPDYPHAPNSTSAWNTVDSKSSLTIGNDATLNFSVSVTPNSSVSDGTYPFDIMVYGTATNQTVKTTATYIVSNLLTATPTPSGALTCNMQCTSDGDCSSGYCYQPPMPPCPSGMVCTQAMPAKVCRKVNNPEDSTCMLPQVPGWWTMIPPDLRNFLEQLYIFVFFFMRPSNMIHLLNGVFPSP